MKSNQVRVNRSIGPQTVQQLLSFQQELDALAELARSQIGARDAAYIRAILRFVRVTEACGRALLLLGGWFPLTWVLGSGLLGLSKIVDNMELGHNVMHGQYDWMNDERFSGLAFEWDFACPKEDWRHAHNVIHHQYTNVIGKDRDFGYGMLRLSGDTKWYPRYLLQIPATVLLALFFQWFVAVHDLALNDVYSGKRQPAANAAAWRRVRAKMWRQFRRDYLAWPLLAAALAWVLTGPSGLAMLAGNVVANMLRNVWAWAIIFCGHFTDGIYTFSKSSIDGETKGQWYLRQILGSSNLSGGKLLHFLSGNLSHQIEHHLFPDLPAKRYAEIAPRVREICAKYQVPYNTGSFASQFITVLKRVLRYGLPGGKKQAVQLGQERPCTDDDARPPATTQLR